MKDEDLIKDVQQLHDLIFTDNCFGSRDILLLEAEIKELERRGYSVSNEEKLYITMEA